MDTLLKKLVCKGQRDHLGHTFYAEDDIREVMDRGSVREALMDKDAGKDCVIEPQYIESAVQAICKDGRKVFAVLVCLHKTKFIRDFAEHTSLDRMFPFKEQVLKKTIREPTTASLFYTRQWEFASPVFDESVFARALPKSSILPFTKDKPIPGGYGAFGIVSQIEIPSSHHNFPVSKLVRKEFKPRDKGENHQQELKNLSMLKLIEHPNIVQLLACYEINNKINFIFPLADGGTLEDLLWNGSVNDVFNSHVDALHAFSGLFSALRSVHNFTLTKFKVDLLGCHHDLKPKNILVHGRKLLLADFGLSRLKEHHEGSETDWKTVHAMYSPPESFVASSTPDKPRVHRSSDIWSLGCITTEFMAFLDGGWQGVRKFYDSRTQKIGADITHRFHDKGALDVTVDKFLQERLDSDDLCQKRVAQICKDLLAINPVSRPNASFASEHIQITTILTVCATIDTLYARVLAMSPSSFEAVLNQAIFESWKDAAGIEDVDAAKSLCGALSDWPADFGAIYVVLTEAEGELETVGQQFGTPVYPVFRRVQNLNDILFNTLSNDAKSRAEQYLRVRMSSRVSATKSPPAAESERDEANQKSWDTFALLASIRVMQEVFEGEGAKAGSLEKARLQKVANFGDFQICRLTGKNGDNDTNTIVEYKHYSSHQSDRSVASELHKRLQHITALLKTANFAGTRAGFRILPCEGFYQDPHTAQCGLVYQFPQSSHADNCFTTLHAMLKLSSDENYKPPLDKRFSLARELSASLANLHSAHWLHRRVSSHNIGFFYHKNVDRSWRRINGSPYFLGFLYSRSDGAGFTEGPTDDEMHRLYQHPHYLKDGTRYQQAYDYYSMGVVLLEIGLWESLEKLQKRNKPNNGVSKSLHDFMRDDCVPRLAISMGKDYRQAVATCLRMGFSDHSGKDEDEVFVAMHQSFLKLVVGQVSKWFHQGKIDKDAYTFDETDLRKLW